MHGKTKEMFTHYIKQQPKRFKQFVRFSFSGLGGLQSIVWPLIFSKTLGKNLVLTFSWFIPGFFFIDSGFFKSPIFSILSPNQPLYDLTWHIRLSKPKRNIFCRWYLMISHFKKGFCVYRDQMNSLCRCQNGQIKFIHISNKTVIL